MKKKNPTASTFITGIIQNVYISIIKIGQTVVWVNQSINVLKIVTWIQQQQQHILISIQKYEEKKQEIFSYFKAHINLVCHYKHDSDIIFRC